ncbi:unnamed protein product [Rangifer tarandus platyrhynchus]|uniref:Uncharacterized protein n=1 Tax=Rangifer tarandus platyrhynchus TaxID=3082113 RepID=A0AC59ZC67_RANTA
MGFGKTVHGLCHGPLNCNKLLFHYKQLKMCRIHLQGFPNGDSGKESLSANVEDARDTGSLPGLGRSPGVGNGYPLQYSCVENSMNWRLQSRMLQRVRHN